MKKKPKKSTRKKKKLIAVDNDNVEDQRIQVLCNVSAAPSTAFRQSDELVGCLAELESCALGRVETFPSASVTSSSSKPTLSEGEYGMNKSGNMRSTASDTAIANDAKNDGHDEDGDEANSKLWDPKIRPQPPPHSSSDGTMDPLCSSLSLLESRINIWNATIGSIESKSSSSRSRASSQPFVWDDLPFVILPNLQVEMARHLQMKKLSSFLLDSCPQLRMPTFERWVIDSKIEETTKRKILDKQRRFQLDEKLEHDIALHGRRDRDRKRGATNKKRRLHTSSHNDDHHEQISPSRPEVNVKTEWDPVLPSLAHPTDEASTRLVTEIVASDSNHDQEKAESLCRELCNRARDAAREVVNIIRRVGRNQRLGGKNADKIVLERRVDFDEIKTDSRPSSMGNQENNRRKKKRLRVDMVQNTQPEEKQGIHSSSASFSSSKTHDVHALVYIRKNKKAKPFVVKINASHYEKLRCMFNKVHGKRRTPRDDCHIPTSHSSIITDVIPSPSESRHKPTAFVHAFHSLLFALLLRYSSLSGGQQLVDLRGGGMQGAVNPSVLAWLYRTLNCTVECFASPLNSYYPQYCSAFYMDLDWHFGALGDFFDLTQTMEGQDEEEEATDNDGDRRFMMEGCYEVNPPFAPGLMKAMASRLERLLNIADRRRSCLTFVVIVPTCTTEQEAAASTTSAKIFGKKRKWKGDDKTIIGADLLVTSSAVQQFAKESFLSMVSSRHCARHMILPAREHGYVEGSQHLRPTRFKQSQYDTSIIVLQSNEARNAKQKTDWDVLEHEMRAAFASRHESELCKRRERGGNEPDGIR